MIPSYRIPFVPVPLFFVSNKNFEHTIEWLLLHYSAVLVQHVFAVPAVPSVLICITITALRSTTKILDWRSFVVTFEAKHYFCLSSSLILANSLVYTNALEEKRLKKKELQFFRALNLEKIFFCDATKKLETWFRYHFLLYYFNFN